MLKNQKIGFWAYAVVAVLAIVCLGLYIANVNQPYYQDMNLSIVFAMVGALVCIAAALVLPAVSDKGVLKVVADVARVAGAALIILAGATFIGMRVESFGYIYGSNLELGNDAAFTAGNQAIWTIVIFVVTWIISVIAAFLPTGKKA
ncbi:MAG: hypothetical protein IJ343_14675 [Clostridia bacterium]|nr:hypothetical protein [Clostridia bacterium]